MQVIIADKQASRQAGSGRSRRDSQPASEHIVFDSVRLPPPWEGGGEGRNGVGDTNISWASEPGRPTWAALYLDLDPDLNIGLEVWVGSKDGSIVLRGCDMWD